MIISNEHLLQLMQERYTTKAYDGTTTLSSEQIATLAELLRLCPSSINSQPWHFTLVGDAATKAALAAVSGMNEPKVSACSHVVVLRCYRNTATFEQERIEFLHPYAREYYLKNIASKGDAAVTAWRERQVYIALGVLLSACAQLGIDTTPMEGIDTEAYDAILNDGIYTTLVAVALGCRADDDQNQPHITPKNRRSSEDVVRII